MGRCHPGLEESNGLMDLELSILREYDEASLKQAVMPAKQNNIQAAWWFISMCLEALGKR